jgi:fatty acid desaturase
MKPSQQIALGAAVAATVTTGLAAWGIQAVFEPTSSTWSSPWLWGSLVVLWLCAVGVFTETFTQQQVLKYMDRDYDRERDKK